MDLFSPVNHVATAVLGVLPSLNYFQRSISWRPGAEDMTGQENLEPAGCRESARWAKRAGDHADNTDK